MTTTRDHTIDANTLPNKESPPMTPIVEGADEVSEYDRLKQQRADIEARQASELERRLHAAEDELARLRSGIRSAALTLVKWAVASGGNTMMAIVASDLRKLIGEPDLKENAK